MIELDTIYNQDCLEGLKALPDKSIDLILTIHPMGRKLIREPMDLERLKIAGILADGTNKPPPNRYSLKCSGLQRT